MSNYKFKQVDFDHPSFLFILEDKIKNLIGGALFYNSYLKIFGLKGDENVLDFGCGGGTGSKCLIKFLNGHGELTCIDTSHYWITIAQKRLKKYPNVQCHHGDIRNLNIPDASFDVISVIHVIHDIAPEIRQEIITSLSQKLKKGGIIFMREPIKISHGMPEEEIRTLLTNAGLKEQQCSKNKSEFFGKYKK